MKKLLLVLALFSSLAFAEATFEQVQVLIQQQNYSAAEKGLEEIIRNHPKSAKAFYAMSQAQAGLGNQEKAKKALDIATGLNPALDFAPASSVANLKEAITPQVKKIEAVEESHTGRNIALALLFIVIVAGTVILYKQAKEKEAANKALAQEAERLQAEVDALAEKELVEKEAAQKVLRQHPNYSNERFDHRNPDVLLPKKTKAQLKEEQLREANARADRAEDEARTVRMRQQYTHSPAPTVVNNSGSDMLTGVLIGNMLGGSGHHDTTRIVEREVIREVPATSRDSSWDDSPSKSSSWDDDSSKSSPSKSSSWDDSSSSSSSSSNWDSGSSSSSSSSSWD